VADYFRSEQNEGWWRMVWSRNLLVWNIAFDNLLVLLNSLICGDGEDWWVWRLGEMKDYSVESAYALLEGLLTSESSRGDLEDRVFKLLWKSPDPSEGIALSWKILLNRIPTRPNLAVHRSFLWKERRIVCSVKDERNRKTIFTVRWRIGYIR